MTTATRLAYAGLIAALTILIAILVCAVTPALDTQSGAYGAINGKVENIALPGLTEDRYVPQDDTTVVTLIESIVPLFLPNTSGQGVCGIDITCDASGSATN